VSRRAYPAIIALILLVGGIYFIGKWSRPEACEVCARPLHERMQCTVKIVGQGERTTCCPRCGLRLQGLNPDEVEGIWVVDYSTGEKIDGREALYVEGSDVHLCCSMAPRRDIQGNRYDLDWDRCLPSLVAFRSRGEAEGFSREHGGEIISYERLLEEIRRESGPGSRGP